jgi:hypothetical protein
MPSQKRARDSKTHGSSCPQPPFTPSPVLEKGRLSQLVSPFLTANGNPGSQSPSREQSPAPKARPIHTPIFPAVKGKRTRRPLAAVEQAVLALPCPSPDAPILQKPRIQARQSPPSKRSPFPRAPLAHVSIQRATLLRKMWKRPSTRCSASRRWEWMGPNFRGTLGVWRSGRAVVTCACRDCVNTYGKQASSRNANTDLGAEKTN